MQTATEHPLHHVTRQMGRIMEQLQKGYYNFAPGETWTPNVNLYETDDAYHVCVDLAGVEKDKIDVVVAHQSLTLRGRREVPPVPGVDPAGVQHGRFRIHLMEVDHGSFSRVVDLPHDVQQDQIDARYLDGMLWIRLPKRSAGSKPVPVEPGGHGPGGQGPQRR
jgi:HSP20 family protein